MAKNTGGAAKRPAVSKKTGAAAPAPDVVKEDKGYSGSGDYQSGKLTSSDPSQATAQQIKEDRIRRREADADETGDAALGVDVETGDQE